MQPKLGVTGYRGIWGESLTEAIAVRYATAFAEFTKENTNKKSPTILIGQDGRESGQAIKNSIIPILKNLGIEVIDGDILPTPTMMYACNKHKYDGGIIITASHNPPKYNGLKFITKEARLTNEAEVEKMKKYL